MGSNPKSYLLLQKNSTQKYCTVCIINVKLNEMPNLSTNITAAETFCSNFSLSFIK